MDNQTVITARDIKEILKSLRKKIKYENRCCRNSIG